MDHSMAPVPSLHCCSPEFDKSGLRASLNHLKYLESSPDFSGFNVRTIKLFYLIHVRCLPSPPAQIPKAWEFAKRFFPVICDTNINEERCKPSLRKGIPPFPPLHLYHLRSSGVQVPEVGILSHSSLASQDSVFVELMREGVLQEPVDSLGVFVPLGGLE